MISSCSLFRYELRRVWQLNKPLVAVIGLNPSRADANCDDPTLRRVVNFAMFWGYGGVVMLNLFAFRSPYPWSLATAVDPVGPDNDAAILRAADKAEMVVAAWGAETWERVQPRAEEVVALLRPRPLHCIALSKGGHPRHPLYLKSILRPQAWRAPWEAEDVQVLGGQS